MAVLVGGDGCVKQVAVKLRGGPGLSITYGEDERGMFLRGTPM